MRTEAELEFSSYCDALVSPANQSSNSHREPHLERLKQLGQLQPGRGTLQQEGPSLVVLHSMEV